ncbi:hypothetical protein X560_0010 [Listeria fleischmannii 1991]|uniref:Uncharacterized protein n=2 Tax=Listeria fleischmannii TaxID=1069827 RepID=A0A2X3GPV8_9LIST|nr:hypothetical protein [Listeria fleischmannii]KMT61430.1 hypothetical protein X560_0010 [Listeria fleischmannii 1991]SQC70408.1 Uncharacterised protein [Listeria fleischmannii subsp. fleischmannii]
MATELRKIILKEHGTINPIEIANKLHITLPPADTQFELELIAAKAIKQFYLQNKK